MTRQLLACGLVVCAGALAALIAALARIAHEGEDLSPD